MRKILIVDDEPSILTLARLGLRREFEVETAASGEEGLSCFERAPADCVVSDHRMPGMTGVEMLAAIRAIAPDVPCILSTGYSADDDLRRAVQEIGVERVLFKPWSPSELLGTLREVLSLTN